MAINPPPLKPDLQWFPVGERYLSYQASDGPWDFIITYENILLVINRHNRYTCGTTKHLDKPTAKRAAEQWRVDHQNEVFLGAK